MSTANINPEEDANHFEINDEFGNSDDCFEIVQEFKIDKDDPLRKVLIDPKVIKDVEDGIIGKDMSAKIDIDIETEAPIKSTCCKTEDRKTEDVKECNCKQKLEENRKTYEMYSDHLKQHHKKQLYDLEQTLKREHDREIKKLQSKFKEDLNKKVNSDSYFEHCGEMTLMELFKISTDIGKSDTEKYLGLGKSELNDDDYENITRNKIFNFNIKKVNNTQDKEDDELLGINPETDYRYFLEIDKKIYDEFLNYRQEKYKTYDIIEKRKYIAEEFQAEIGKIIDSELNAANTISKLATQNY